jgi:hypothetical protein
MCPRFFRNPSRITANCTEEGVWTTTEHVFAKTWKCQNISNDYYEPDNSEWVEMKNSRNSMSEACHDVVADEKNDEINNFNESLAFHLDEMLEEESLDLSL